MHGKLKIFLAKKKRQTGPLFGPFDGVKIKQNGERELEGIRERRNLNSCQCVSGPLLFDA